MASSDSKFEKIAVNFRELYSVASTLNSASDELTRAVSILDEALKKLNLGLIVWVNYDNHADDASEDFDNDQIGYSKVNGKWGIALQRVWGDRQDGTTGSDGPWLYSDAPREMRVKSVDKIPELIEVLSERARDTTSKIQEKTQEVRDLAIVIDEIARLQNEGLNPPSSSRQWRALDPTPDNQWRALDPLNSKRKIQLADDLMGGKKGGK
jgi:hypothetical protein